jgi:type I thyroxine 5'-deiodinase
VPALNTLYEQYRDRAAFYIVYIQEAHPIDAWQMDDNVADDVLVASTRTKHERMNVAGLCVTKLGIKLPALVDDADDRVERAYTGWPDRLYVIDREGMIAYKSAAGPFGFTPSGVKDTLERLVPATHASRGSMPIRSESR